MSGKTSFAIDYLNVMRTMQMLETDSATLNPLAENMCMIFLHGWGFSFEEFSIANDKFNEKWKNDDLANPSEALSRIAQHLGKDEDRKRNFIVEAVALAALDGDLSEGEGAILRAFQQEMDLKPSELEELLNQGFQVKNMFVLFGKQYSEQ